MNGTPDQSPNYTNKLYALLLEKLPEHVDDFEGGKSLNISKMAIDMGVARQSPYNWLWKDWIAPEYGKKMVSLPGSLLTIEDITPFFFKD